MKKTHNPQKEPKKRRERHGKKTLVYALGREGGLSVQEAGKIAGYSPSYLRSGVYQTEKKIRTGLLSPLVGLAKKSVKATLKGQCVGGADPPKASDVLRAAEMVLDRYDPKIQHIEQKSVSVDMELTPEELARYRKALGLPEPQG